ncbi:MAG: HipA domain-containing protein [Myxococcaceae bacterium]|nr:HipA domain-containing protein [Myxococcaceae bacterium]MBH2006329.1 HipA domain-containing protein [Myxococcaceae bacterium]
MDTLFLWYVAKPSDPKLIGELRLVQSSRGVSLCYVDSWVQTGFSLSEDLPLQAGHEFLPMEKDSAVGAVDDARPDRWGERVIRLLNKPSRLSLMEYLYFSGDNRLGALGVSRSSTRYIPCPDNPLPTLKDIHTLQELIEKVLASEPIPENQRPLISPSVSMGGAKPKALVSINQEPWILKFAPGDSIDRALIEHASMTLAEQAKIRIAETRAIPTHLGHVLAIKRFDRYKEQRLHVLSAHVALRAAGETYGYPELALLLRRKGEAADIQELFRRMVFNILMDNTDDHEKNHALLVRKSGQYSLSPAYDVLPSGQALGFQQMRVGQDGADSTIDNALSEAQFFGLTRSEAVSEVKRVVRVVNTWKEHFKNVGVSGRDIEQTAEQVERPFLIEQRKAFV